MVTPLAERMLGFEGSFWLWVDYWVSDVNVRVLNRGHFRIICCRMCLECAAESDLEVAEMSLHE